MTTLFQQAYQPHLCECGCGLPTTRIRQTCTAKGRIKGEYNRFLFGHRGKTGNEGFQYERTVHYKPKPKNPRSAYQLSARDRHGKIRI